MSFQCCHSDLQNDITVYLAIKIDRRLKINIGSLWNWALWPILQTNKIHDKINCQFHHSDLWHHTWLSNSDWFAVKINLGFLWNRPLVSTVGNESYTFSFKFSHFLLWPYPIRFALLHHGTLPSTIPHIWIEWQDPMSASTWLWSP